MRRTNASPTQQEAAILKAAAEEVALVGVGRLEHGGDRPAGRSQPKHAVPPLSQPGCAGHRTGQADLRFRYGATADGRDRQRPEEAAVAAFREGVRLLTGEPVMRRFLQLDGDFTATTGMFDEARVFLVSASTAMAKALRSAGATMSDATCSRWRSCTSAWPPHWSRSAVPGAGCHRRQRGGRLRPDPSGTLVR